MRQKHETNVVAVILGMILFAIGFLVAIFFWESFKARMSPLKMAKGLWRAEIKEGGYLDQLDEGRQLIKKPNSLGPAFGHLYCATAYVGLGRYEEALASFAQAKQADPGRYGTLQQARTVAFGFAERGRSAEAMQLLEQLHAEFPLHNRSAMARFLARTKNAKLRDPARAMEVLQPDFDDDAIRSAWTRYDWELWAVILGGNHLFPDAIEAAEKALKLPAANSHVAANDEERIQHLIELFTEEKEPPPATGW